MTFHHSKDFVDAIEAAAQHYGMQPVFIEKDYWVTYALKNLSNSEQYSTTVFKGGTSLSKVHNCIQRFSEDVDLAIIAEPTPSQMQVKKQMKAVEIAAASGLTLLEDPPPVKKGKNRFSCYEYPTILEEGHLVASPYVRLEISAFTQPTPYEEKQIQSYIGIYLEENDLSKTVTDFGLESFPILVLSIERTFCEKLLSLLRLSYNGTDSLKAKIRHFHDLARLLDKESIQKMLIEKDHSILDSAYQDDKSNTTFQGDWTKSPFSEAPLFSDFENIWNEIRDTYHSELSELSWAEEIPSDEDIHNTIEQLRAYLIGYDNV